jgi:hypothetical protein
MRFSGVDDLPPNQAIINCDISSQARSSLVHEERDFMEKITKPQASATFSGCSSPLVVRILI